MWLEYIRDGALRLLLAPIHKVGGDKDPVYDYLRKVHATKSCQESTRLLYVAATRAGGGGIFWGTPGSIKTGQRSKRRTHGRC